MGIERDIFLLSVCLRLERVGLVVDRSLQTRVLSTGDKMDRLNYYSGKRRRVVVLVRTITLGGGADLGYGRIGDLSFY
jgi:hypothetical protein